jgi:hypothetical protein
LTAPMGEALFPVPGPATLDLGDAVLAAERSDTILLDDHVEPSPFDVPQAGRGNIVPIAMRNDKHIHNLWDDIRAMDIDLTVYPKRREIVVFVILTLLNLIFLFCLTYFTGYLLPFIVTTSILQFIIVYWLLKRYHYEKYFYAGEANILREDLRSDSVAVGKLVHMDAKFCYVGYKRWDVMRARFSKTDRFKISVEMLVQLTTAANLDLNAKPDVAWERIRFCSKNMNSVNLDRYDALRHEHVVQQTQLVAFAMFRDMQFRRRMHSFPRTLSV